MPNSMALNSNKSIRHSENPDPELMPWKATKLTMAALCDLERRGILRLLRINARVIVIDRNDWRAMPERLAAERRQAKLGAAGLTTQAADALLKLYGHIPGVAR